MDKTAQKRSILNKIHEGVGGVMESAKSVLNPELKEIMDSLRTSDNKIRSIASGTSIGGEDAGDDAISLKDLLKNAKSFLNRREYMTAIAFLGRFQKKMSEVKSAIQEINLNVDKVHDSFLFNGLDEDHKGHLNDLKKRFAVSQPQLVAEASIADILVNIGTKRGKALKDWENKYPKRIGKLKGDANKLFGSSNKLLNDLLSSLKEMASFRAGRQIDDYVKRANAFSRAYDIYNTEFKTFYENNIKGFLDKQELVATKPVDDKKEIAPGTPMPSKSVSDVDSDSPIYSPPPGHIGRKVEMPNIPDLDVPGDTPPPSSAPRPPVISPSAPVSSGVNSNPPTVPSANPLTPPRMPTNLGPAVPQRDTISSPPPGDELDTEPSHEIPPPPSKAAHSKFYKSLEVMSNEKPALLKAHILKYANSIKSTDFITALKLLNIAKDIKE